ncbi:MAG: metallophosphoesterase family protein [Bacteroidota bacterium]
MKKILLISDTHGYLDDAILEHIKQSDEVWHAGDIGTIEIADQISHLKPLRAVYGNIDGHVIRSAYPQDLIFTCEGLKVFITHIGGYPTRYSKGIKEKLIIHRPELFICGHSHILKIMRDQSHQLLHMNPGAAGVHGFHKMRTMIRINIEEGKIQEVAVIELGLRGSLT